MPRLPRIPLVGGAEDELPEALNPDVHLRETDDGQRLVRQLEQENAFHDISGVILTGRVLSHRRELVARPGCDLVVPKPCQPDALSSVVASLIRRRRATGYVTTR